MSSPNLYQFSKGEHVCVFQGGVLKALSKVVRQQDGVVSLEDGTEWFAATGLPVQGRGDRRMSTLTPALLAQVRRVGALLRLVELAAIIQEAATFSWPVQETDVARAEGALLEVLRGRFTGGAEGRAVFFERVKRRLAEAEAGAFERVRVDLT